MKPTSKGTPCVEAPATRNNARLHAFHSTLACGVRVAFLAAALFTAPRLAAQIITATVTITNAPTTNGQTLTVNGDVRTWTNITAEISKVWIPTNSAIDTAATNLWKHTALYRYTGPLLTLGWGGSNIITLTGPPGGALAASASGSWASVTLSTQSTGGLTPVAVPFSTLAATNATNIASLLVKGISDSATNSFAPGNIALSNYVDNATTQGGIAGAKTFTGANIYANADQLFAGGQVSNATVNAGILTNSEMRRVWVQSGTDTNRAIIFTQDGFSPGPLGVGSRIIANGDGYPQLVIGWGADPAEAQFDADILNLYSAKLNFPQKDAVVVNTWYSTNDFWFLTAHGGYLTNLNAQSGTVSNLVVTNSSILGGTITNAITYGLASYQFQALTGYLTNLTESTGWGTNMWFTNGVWLGGVSTNLAVQGGTISGATLLAGGGTNVLLTNSTFTGATLSGSFTNGVLWNSAGTNVLLTNSTFTGGTLVGPITNGFFTGTGMTNASLTNTTAYLATDFVNDVAYQRVSISTVVDGSNIITNGPSGAVNSFIKVQPGTLSATWQLVGITGGRDGKRVLIYNKSGFNMEVTNDSGLAAAGDRIYTLQAGTPATTGNGVMEFIYDSEDSRWILISIKD